MLNVDGWTDRRADGNLHAYVFQLKQVRQKGSSKINIVWTDAQRPVPWLWIGSAEVRGGGGGGGGKCR